LSVAPGSSCCTMSFNIIPAAAGLRSVFKTKVAFPVTTPDPCATKISACGHPARLSGSIVDHADDLHDAIRAEPSGKQADKASPRGRPPIVEVGLRERVVDQQRTDRSC